MIEGLESGDFAVLTKIHHATVDGAAGAILTTMLLDDAPDSPLPVPGDRPKPDSMPSNGELLLRAMGTLVRQPDRAIRIPLRLAQQFAQPQQHEPKGSASSSDRPVASLPAHAVHAPTATPHRRLPPPPRHARRSTP